MMQLGTIIPTSVVALFVFLSLSSSPQKMVLRELDPWFRAQDALYVIHPTMNTTVSTSIDTLNDAGVQDVASSVAHGNHTKLMIPKGAKSHRTNLTSPAKAGPGNVSASFKVRSVTLKESSTSVSKADQRKATPQQPQASILPRHDNSSMTTFMWYKGKPFDVSKDERPPASSPITIDAVSVGSKFAVSQLKGQVASWGSHSSVRFLFGTTEQDDAHPTCYKDLNQTQFMAIARVCKRQRYNRNRLQALHTQFPRGKWIRKEKKTHGWLCAQKRFPHSLAKVARFYRREGVIPDFLVIGDDDSWYGMNQVTKLLQSMNQTVPLVTAGCKVEWPVGLVQFNFPFGGFGLFFNRLAIERLIKPIYCQGKKAQMNAHTKHVCSRLEENLAGERMAFQEGMSISDLMDRHAAMLPYPKFREWNDPGYCMIGDWVLGYYVNYYALGSRINDLEYMHMDGAMGHIYGKNYGSCRNNGLSKCRMSDTQYACHRLKPDEMMEMHMRDAQKGINATTS